MVFPTFLHILRHSSRKTAAEKPPQCVAFLLFAEGLAVGALICSRIDFVGAHQDLVQGTVVLMAAVMGALLDGALDALVCVIVHGVSSFFRNGDSMTKSETVMRMGRNQYFFICYILLRLTSV